jgi:hypothetical protein
MSNFNFNFSNESSSTEHLERIEEQCDRQTESYLWGAYKAEKVDCPKPHEGHQELDTHDHHDHSFDHSPHDDVAH